MKTIAKSICSTLAAFAASAVLGFVVLAIGAQTAYGAPGGRRSIRPEIYTKRIPVAATFTDLTPDGVQSTFASVDFGGVSECRKEREA